MTVTHVFFLPHKKPNEVNQSTARGEVNERELLPVRTDLSYQFKWVCRIKKKKYRYGTVAPHKVHTPTFCKREFPTADAPLVELSPNPRTIIFPETNAYDRYTTFLYFGFRST